MTDWKKAYSTWLFIAVAVAGAALTAVQDMVSGGFSVPPWVLPVIGAIGVFLRRLPQGGSDE